MERFADGCRPADGSCEEPAELVVRRILAHEWDELRASTAAATRDVLIPERLEAVTVAEIDPHGHLDRLQVLDVWTVGDGTHVDLAAHQAHGVTEYTVCFDADGRLSGLRLTNSTPISTSG